MSDTKTLEELVRTTLQQIKKGVKDSGDGNLPRPVRFRVHIDDEARPVTENGGTAVGAVEFEVEFDVRIGGH